MLSRKLQKENGYVCIGGLNGSARKYFTAHPNAKTIFNKVDARGGSWTDQDFLDDLFASGAKALVTAKRGLDIIVITDEMILVYGTPQNPSAGSKGQLFTQDGWKTFRSCLICYDVTASKPPICGRTISQSCAFTYVGDGKFFELDTLYKADGSIDSNPLPRDFQQLFRP
jgi:hypothetical protein